MAFRDVNSAIGAYGTLSSYCHFFSNPIHNSCLRDQRRFSVRFQHGRKYQVLLYPL